MRLLVTGATGFIGHHVVLAALEAGHHVRGLIRDRAKAEGLFGDRPVELSVGDLLSRRDLIDALVGVDVLVHAAATYSYRRQDAETMLRETPALVEAVLGAARDAGTPHVIEVSSAVVLRPQPEGPGAGTVSVDSPLWDESQPPWGDPYLRGKVLGEEAARLARTKGGAISTIHPSLVVGPGDRGPGQSGAVVVALLASPSVYVDAGGGWVDVRDVAEAVLRLVDRPPGGRYILNGTDARYRQVATELDRLTGRSVRRVWLPPGIVRTAASINDRLSGRLLPELPVRAALEWPLTIGPIDGTSGERLLERPYRTLADSLADGIRWWAEQGTIPRALAGRLAGPPG